MKKFTKIYCSRQGKLIPYERVLSNAPFFWRRGREVVSRKDNTQMAAQGAMETETPTT